MSNEAIPVEILQLILQEADTHDLCSAAAVCKHWKLAARVDFLWRQKFYSRWDPYLESQGNSDLSDDFFFLYIRMAENQAQYQGESAASLLWKVPLSPTPMATLALLLNTDRVITLGNSSSSTHQIYEIAKASGEYRTLPFNQPVGRERNEIPSIPEYPFLCGRRKGASFSRQLAARLQGSATAGGATVEPKETPKFTVLNQENDGILVASSSGKEIWRTEVGSDALVIAASDLYVAVACIFGSSGVIFSLETITIYCATTGRKVRSLWFQIWGAYLRYSCLFVAPHLCLHVSPSEIQVINIVDGTIEAQAEIPPRFSLSHRFLVHGNKLTITPFDGNEVIVLDCFDRLKTVAHVKNLPSSPLYALMDHDGSLFIHTGTELQKFQIHPSSKDPRKPKLRA